MKNLLVATIVTLLLAPVAWAGTVFTPGSTTDDIGSADYAWDVGYFRSISFEGTSANAYEGLLTMTDPTADRTLYLPDYDGYLLISISDDHEPQTADAVWFDSGAFVFEGATADAYETSLTVTDPTVDRTITLPDYSGAIPLVVSQGDTQTSLSAVSTSDVTGSSVTVADGWFTDGEVLKWTLVGTITGANDAKTVHLYIDDGTIVSLALDAATVGDYIAEFEMYASNSTLQKCHGVLHVAGNAETEFDYATDTTDFNDGGTTTVKCQIQLANASDSITVEKVRVETWEQ